MRNSAIFRLVSGAAIVVSAALLSAAPSDDRSPHAHKIHDMERPLPPAVDPGPAGPPAPAPSDAIVLFDGSGFDEWRATDGSEAKWKLDEGAMRVVPGAGDIQTVRTFGD